MNYTDDIYETLTLQDDLQRKYTGGTVLHIFIGEQMTDIDAIKNLVKKISSGFHLPYFTITPTFSVCPSHGYLRGEQALCPECHQETETYSRVVGYLRPIKQWNDGKLAEYKKRVLYNMAPKPSRVSVITKTKDQKKSVLSILSDEAVQPETPNAFISNRP